MELTFDLGIVETTMLAGVRLVAFLAVAPPFHLRVFPGPVKVALAFGIALLAGPKAVAASGMTPGVLLGSGTAQFLGALVLQLFVGLALGFLVKLIFAAVQAAGAMIDLFGGFQLAFGFDPTSQTQGAVFSRLYEFSAIALLFASNGHQLVLAGLVRSFDALPLGQGISLAALSQLMTHGVADLMVSALQIAGPLVVVLFLADVGLGLLTRVAPALNAFALGFPLKILMTLSLGSIAYLTLPHIVNQLTEQAASLLLGVKS